MSERAPENKDEHIRQLLKVNEQQAEQIRRLRHVDDENLKLRVENKRLKASV